MCCVGKILVKLQPVWNDNASLHLTLKETLGIRIVPKQVTVFDNEKLLYTFVIVISWVVASCDGDTHKSKRMFRGNGS